MNGPENLICSMGGVGTTALIEYLSRLMSVNPAHGDYNPIKHSLYPPQDPGIQRAVFLFGDPGAALASLFRRGLDAAHHRNIHGNPPSPDPRIDEDPWLVTVRQFGLHEVQPGKWVDTRGRAASDIGALDELAQRKAAKKAAQAHRDALTRQRAGYVGLDDILGRGLDPFSWRRQWAAWQRGAPGYPILLMRYEALWQNLDTLMAFLGKPEVALKLGPYRPRIGAQHLSQDQQLRLRIWSAQVGAAIEVWPDVRRVDATGQSQVAR